MAAPVTGVTKSAEELSDPHITTNDIKSPNLAENNLIIAQLSKASHAPSLGKRRKSKPMRFVASRIDVQNELPPPKIKIFHQQVPNNPSNPCLSLHKESSPALKGFKTPVPSSHAMIRAGEVQSSLGIEFPSCIKVMVKSQVTCGFWMGLPLAFCRSFLPKEDSAFVLEDENGKHWEVKYIAYKSGFSAGWKHFAVAHNLIEGDVLVFHLVKSCKFKVYIFKVNDSNEVNGALSLLNLEAQPEQMTPDTPSPRTKKTKRQESLSLAMIRKKHKKSAIPSRSIPLLDHSGNDSEEVGSEVLEGSASGSRKPNLSFQEVKAFEDFHIMVNGVCIDSELPTDVKKGYFNLCIEKKEFLHDGLPEALYYKLVAGMIGETVTIANAIKNCKLTTTKEEFDVWDNSLKSFELLGMKVGFLRNRVRTLVGISFESEGALDAKKYLEMKNKQKWIKEEMKKVAAKLLELKESAKKIEGISGCLKQKAEKYEHKFQKEVSAAW